tara:strand:+ start:2207 stop:2992 length:786 start_codon:yes stop_codon:yes gene_type:complete
MALTGKSPAGTYKDLLTIENSNNGVDSTLRSVNTGNGSSTSISVSNRALQVKSSVNNVRTLAINDASDSTKFYVDTTNSQVKALGHNVNTQYATFSVGNTESTAFAANTHQALTFGNANYGTLGNGPSFGTLTDPATSFTTSDSASSRGADLVPCLWYVPDNISIDGVYSLEGADAATGDTTRMHLMSYRFTSGNTAALISGTVLAHNDDVTNDGGEQSYLSTWTVDSADVVAGRVIMAMFRSDSINSDYSLQVVVKYHLT